MIETVTVGDVGNSADISNVFEGVSTGAVGYEYAIGKYEVTNSQYAVFLNAKARTDPHGLYNELMNPSAIPGFTNGVHGGIVRSGSDGNYSYSTVSGREDRPVNWVSFWDAARFVNWLHNGQGYGDTELGTYTLTASAISANTVSRNTNATWVIPNADEWCKAAYYRGGGLNSGYWLYGTASNEISTAMANYDGAVGTLTSVGSYAARSAYGAFDMAGNVWEWNERTVEGITRTYKGGAFDTHYSNTWSEYHIFTNPQFVDYNIGFRVAIVPAPGAAALVGLAGLVGGRRRRA